MKPTHNIPTPPHKELVRYEGGKGGTITVNLEHHSHDDGVSDVRKLVTYKDGEKISQFIDGGGEFSTPLRDFSGTHKMADGTYVRHTIAKSPNENTSTGLNAHQAKSVLSAWKGDYEVTQKRNADRLEQMFHGHATLSTLREKIGGHASKSLWASDDPANNREYPSHKEGRDMRAEFTDLSRKHPAAAAWLRAEGKGHGHAEVRTHLLNGGTPDEAEAIRDNADAAYRKKMDESGY